MTESKAIRPQPGPQEAFLSTPADIAIYGGAAGGGKTWALLLEPLRHITNSQFGAVVFRRTYKQVTQQGGMWDQSMALYPLVQGVDKESALEWTFPKGSRVSFAHLQHNKNRYDWQGAQIPLLAFDELTHFTAKQFWYLISRNRSTCGVRPYTRATTNPDADSWVADLVRWWIDQETGYAIPERSGVIRWFVRDGDVLKWYSSQSDAGRDYPDLPAKSFTFIAASLADNPLLMEADPGYLANLLALPYVEREQLLAGNWKVRPAAGKVFNRAWFEIVDAVPAGGLECDGWDFAATAKEQRGDDPDYTAGVGVRKVGGQWYVTWMQAEQVANADPLLRNLSAQHRQRCASSGTRYRVRWEIEPAASGKKENRRLTGMMAGYDARGVRPGGDKLTRSRALAAQAQPPASNVKLLRGPWNETFLQHMHAIPDGDHDDIHDAAAIAFNGTLSGQWDQFLGDDG